MMYEYIFIQLQLLSGCHTPLPTPHVLIKDTTPFEGQILKRGYWQELMKSNGGVT